MNIPATPTQYAGTVAASADMNSLSASAAFVAGPPFVIIQTSTTATQNVGTAAAALTWSLALRNNDTNWASGAPTILTINTQGLYECRYQIALAFVASAVMRAYIQVVTGTNNPVGSGVTTTYWSTQTASVLSGVVSACVGGGVIPVELYPGDQVSIMAFSTVATTTTTNHWCQASLRMVST